MAKLRKIGPKDPDGNEATDRVLGEAVNGQCGFNGVESDPKFRVDPTTAARPNGYVSAADTTTR